MPTNNLSLSQIFGKGASQDATTLVIQKNDLLRLTPEENNTVESLLAAILITALSAFSGNLTTEQGEEITTENNEPLSFDNSEFFELIKMFPWQPFQITRNNQKYISNQIIIEIYDPN